MPLTNHHLYEFGPFRVDADERVLWRENHPVPLTPKVFDLLLVLVENRGHLLDKEDLLQKVWPDSFVEEANLSVNISVLRRALSEVAGETQFIETVPRRGYRFVAEINERTQGNSVVEELVIAERTRASVTIEETEDDVKAAEITAVTQPHRMKRSVITSITLFAVLVAGLAGWWQWRRAENATATNVKTIALLPFRSLNPQSGKEYLGIGMADVMITRLSNLSQLIVRPTNSVLPFSTQDPLQAGQALQVNSVLDGSIQQNGNRVRITMRLLRTSDGKSLWAYQCDEQCTDIFALQDTVSARVTGALALKLTGDERQRMNRRYTDNTAAYQFYLKGRYHTLQYTPEGNKQAVTERNEALRLDPNYALTWAGLADAYTAASNWLLPPREALPKARAAAEKALALDDTLAEAHAALGHVFVHQFNPAAEREFKRAMELSPNSVAAMFFYFEYFCGKDADKSVAVLRRVQQLDPLSPTAGSFIASAYLMARRNDEAFEEAKKTVELDPNNPFSRELLASSYGAKGNHTVAIAELEKIKPMLPTAEVTGMLGMEYALAGRRDDALKMLAELKQMAQQQYVSPFSVALVYVGLGDKDQVFADLEKAREDQCEWMGWLQSTAILDPLRDDPRFADLVRRVGPSQ